MAERLTAWERIGNLGYWFARWPISLVVRNSHRTRVLVVCGDEYLVVKHWLGNGGWMMPGGGCHRSELPIIGAQRELREEVGLAVAVDQLAHLGRYVCRDGPFKFSYDLFLVRLSEKPVLKLQRLEILSAQWLRRSVTPAQRLAPELQQALQRWEETA